MLILEPLNYKMQLIFFKSMKNQKVDLLFNEICYKINEAIGEKNWIEIIP